MGLKIVEAMVGENPLTHTIKKKDLAIQIPSKSVIKVAEFSMDTCGSAAPLPESIKLCFIWGGQHNTRRVFKV